MKTAVIYSSVTGNTKKIAEKIFESLEDAEIFELKDAPEDLSQYDLIFLGYWLKRGAPDLNMTKFLPKVKNTKVVFFQTHGTEKNSEHAVTAFARAAYLLGENCKIIGTFGCQGKINPALIENRKKIPNDPHGGEQGILRWKSAETHPDENDLQDVVEFVEKMQIKLNIIAAYEKSLFKVAP